MIFVLIRKRPRAEGDEHSSVSPTSTSAGKQSGAEEGLADAQGPKSEGNVWSVNTASNPALYPKLKY